MQQLTTNRAAVLRVMERAQAALEQQAAGAGPALAAAAPAGPVSPGEAAELAAQLRSAREWAHTSEPGMMEKTDELDELAPGGGDYVSHHRVIAQTQAAMEQFADEVPGTAGPDDDEEVPLDLLIGVLSFLVRDKAKFRTHQSLDDLVSPLDANATVVVVGDFGTAKQRAIRVAQAIRGVDPDHVIHLGDVYPTGTPALVRRHFIDVMRTHGPAGAKFWALNGNHEMAARGIGYFNDILPFCGQRASYFSLQNEHWKLIGLDTAYREHDLQAEQKPWLHARLREGTSRNILLTHHQMFSADDGRPHDNRHRLTTTMQEFVQTGRIFGWFWGHEHRFLSYARDPAFGGYLARSLGHGGKRIKYVTGEHRFPAPPVVHYWEARRPQTADECLNGFAILRFAGPEVTLSYADETGFEWNTEIWPGRPHGTP
ncbi:MAG TPA: metallophosphoesterase [Longimicrobium sp.]